MVVAGVVLCAVLGTALAFGIRADAERTDARQIATRSRKVSDATADLLKAVLDLQAGLRGYALTGSRAFLERSERARAPLFVADGESSQAERRSAARAAPLGPGIGRNARAV